MPPSYRAEKMLFVTPAWSIMVPFQWCGKCICRDYTAPLTQGCSLVLISKDFYRPVPVPKQGGSTAQRPWQCAAAKHFLKMDGADGAQNAAGWSSQLSL